MFVFYRHKLQRNQQLVFQEAVKGAGKVLKGLNITL